MCFEFARVITIEKAIQDNDTSSAFDMVQSRIQGWTLASPTSFAVLADHSLPCVKLGHHYSATENIPLAMQYFASARREGPHYASIYNAGRLLADQGDWVGTILYLNVVSIIFTRIYFCGNYTIGVASLRYHLEANGQRGTHSDASGWCFHLWVA